MSRNIRGTHIAKKFKAPYDLAVSDNSNRLSNETQVQLAEFSKKIQQNPYAIMLSTSLRKCTFHERVMPQGFLTRFTTGIDQNTNTVWAVPTLGDRHERGIGQGRYVVQNKQALDAFEQTARYKYTFRGKAHYRPDMTDYIESKLVEKAWSRMQAHLQRPDLITILQASAGGWTAQSSCSDNCSKLAFAIAFDKTTSGPFRTIETISQHNTTNNIPLYNADAIWDSKVSKYLKSRIPGLANTGQDGFAIALSSGPETLKTSIALWKLAGYRRSVNKS